MAEFLRKARKSDPRQLRFFLLIIVLAFVVVVFSVYTLVFLLSNLNSALSADEAIRAVPPKFDIESYEALNLRK